MKSGTLGCLATSGASAGLTSARFDRNNPLEAKAFWMAVGKAARYSLGDWLVSISVLRLGIEMCCNCRAGSVAKLALSRIRGGLDSGSSLIVAGLKSSSSGLSGVLLLVDGEILFSSWSLVLAHSWSPEIENCD